MIRQELGLNNELRAAPLLFLRRIPTNGTYIGTRSGKVDIVDTGNYQQQCRQYGKT